ncbi:hypothetical protein [Streptomyces sp. NPDC085937]|uniref:hypothetical protein n=1 Tax=Streptomyces sp. NPDC085937 TaxID=3365742 RepID=UPI0037CF09FD
MLFSPFGRPGPSDRAPFAGLDVPAAAGRDIVRAGADAGRAAAPYRIQLRRVRHRAHPRW